MQWGTVIGASLLAAIYDLRVRRIPNAITGPLLVAGIAWAVVAGGLRALGGAVGACALLALPYVVLFLLGKGGAGDAKLMGAIGAWVGLADGVIVLVCVAVAGAVLGIANAAARGRLGFILINAVCWLFALAGYMIRYVMRGKPNAAESYGGQYAYVHRLTGLSIPYGVAIFVGVCIAGGYVLLCK